MYLLRSSPIKKLEHSYGPLITNNVKTILESGLLLDEDYEVLLKLANFKIYATRTWPNLPLGLIACVTSTVVSGIFAKRYDQPLVVIAPFGLTITKFYLEVKAIIKQSRRKEVTSKVVGNLAKARKLNKAIVEYLKIRTDVNSKHKETLILNNRNVEEFLKFFIESGTEMLYYLLNELNFISCLTEELIDDFQGIKELDVTAILQLNNFQQPESAALKLYDLCALLTSKFLNYLGVTFCKLLNDFSHKEIECLLDTTLPRLNQKLIEFLDTAQKEFNNLRYCTFQKIQLHNDKPLKRHISGKLHQTLVCSVNNLAIIMEKSQIVLQKADNLDKTKNIKELELSLTDLRDHAFATYESLDVLCRLYGILSKSEKKIQEKSKDFNTNKEEIPAILSTVNFDDVLEPLEENYELYLAKDDNSLLEDHVGLFEDQSTAYLGLMIKELGQSLKQHNRFVEARNKRGIKEEDQTSAIRMEKERKLEEKKQLPKFDLTTVNSSFSKLTENDNESKPLPLLPAPPPPPMPSVVNVENIEESNGKTSLLKGIQTLSSQMAREEETFGDGQSDNESESD